VWFVGRIEAQSTGNKPATRIDMEKLKQEVQRYPDAYQYERAERFGVSQTGIGAALRRLGISRKKNLSPPQADIVARCAFKEKITAYQEAHQPSVYIDESGFARDMPRPNGYAPVGERGLGQPNWHAKGRLKLIGALLASGLLTVSLFSGSINANTFYAGLAPDLLPKLSHGQGVMVMDNATFHKRADLRQLIQDAGPRLEYLSAYSPDLNPIEHNWAQSKAIRKQKNCSVEELFAHQVR
jgi:transposase